MTQTMSFFDLRDALAMPGCAVCRLNEESADRFVSSLLWERVNDPHTRHDIRRARGFCREHARKLKYSGDALGVSIIVRDVLQGVLEDMEGARFHRPSRLSVRAWKASVSGDSSAATGKIVGLLSPRSPCPVCVQVSAMEDVYLSVLVRELMGDDGLLADYRASDGLCLPHFRLVLGRVYDEAVFDALVNAQRDIWEGLVEQLGEVIRKHDYRFCGETWGDEKGSWARAVDTLSGLVPGKKDTL